MTNEKRTHLYQQCPICGKVTNMWVPTKRLIQYESRDGLIQDIFPEFNPMEREWIKSGMCPEDQKTLFYSNYKSRRIKSA